MQRRADGTPPHYFDEVILSHAGSRGVSPARRREVSFAIVEEEVEEEVAVCVPRDSGGAGS